MPRHILVAVAWPYANGVQHLGHIAGCYLPADIFARYHRVAGNRVLMVSGSDAHGTPITVKADQEGVEPAEIVDRYHPLILDQWEQLGISFDLFTTTMTDNHRDVTWEMFRALHANGYIETRTTEQYFDPEAQRFLPDRYVEGTCPNCGYDGARGDQCDNCGKTLDPTDLIDPLSKLSGAAPELRETEHYFLLLTKLEDEVLSWLEGREGWRPHVINWALGFVREGFHDRAITRDISWGVPIPPELDTIGDGKRIYVWFEAVIGYLSAAKEWAQRSADADAWRAWWEDPEAGTYYFIGKDNIPFHAVFWPAQLMGTGGLNLPTDVPANQYVTFRGEKASKSRGVGTTVLESLQTYSADALRYALARNLPETSDTELTEAEIVRRINDELVATWGNLVHRVLTMTQNTFAGEVPPAGARGEADTTVLEQVDEGLAEVGALIERVQLRAALATAFTAASHVNAYLNLKEPWRTAKTDRDATAVTLSTALEAIATLAVALYPFLPFSSQAVHVQLGGDGSIEAAGWTRRTLAAGTHLAPSGPLFTKAELAPDE